MTQSLQRLLTWFSPAFPIGAFAWSGGLETAIEDGLVSDGMTTRMWIGGLLRQGSLMTDAIFVGEAWRAGEDRARLGQLAQLCLAYVSAGERRVETLTTGAAFIAAAQPWSGRGLPTPPDCPYPIAVGSLAAAQDIGEMDAIAAYLTASVQALVSVAVRLVPIGHVAGLGVLAAIEDEIGDAARRACASGVDDIGTLAFASEIAQMRHETQTTRIFRS